MLAQAEHDVDCECHAGHDLELDSRRLWRRNRTAARDLAHRECRARGRSTRRLHLLFSKRWRTRLHARQPVCAGASEPARCVPASADQECRHGISGPRLARIRGRLRRRSEPRSADQRRGAAARRFVGRRFREGDCGSAAVALRVATSLRPQSQRWPERKVWRRTHAPWRFVLSVKSVYEEIKLE